MMQGVAIIGSKTYNEMGETMVMNSRWRAILGIGIALLAVGVIAVIESYANRNNSNLQISLIMLLSGIILTLAASKHW